MCATPEKRCVKGARGPNAFKKTVVCQVVCAIQLMIDLWVWCKSDVMAPYLQLKFSVTGQLTTAITSLAKTTPTGYEKLLQMRFAKTGQNGATQHKQRYKCKKREHTLTPAVQRGASKSIKRKTPELYLASQA